MEEPDKWCIKVTPENKKAIEKWRTANVTLNGYGYCVNETSFKSTIGYWYPDKPSGYTEISFEEFKVYTSKPKDLTGRYVKCLVDEAQGTKCKAGEIYKLVSLDNIVKTQVYKLEDGFCLCVSPTTANKWELLPEDYSADKPLIQAVHCKTQEEWDFVLSKLPSNCALSKQSNDFKEFIKDNSSGIAIDVSDCSWCDIDYWKENNYQILSFQEWCDLNEYKMKPKFEVDKWYSFNWKWCSSNSTVIAKIREVNEESFSISWRSYLWIENNYNTFDRYKFKDISNIKELSLEEVQQYLPESHPDKIKSNQEFKVGDYVVLQYSSAKEIGYDATSNNTRLKAGHIDKIANFRDGQTWSENSKIRWVGLASDPHNGVIEILLRHATPEEIKNHLISIGQIPADEPLNTNSLKMILSIDDEELPMVSIIKTNTVKQLLNND